MAGFNLRPVRNLRIGHFDEGLTAGVDPEDLSRVKTIGRQVKGKQLWRCIAAVPVRRLTGRFAGLHFYFALTGVFAQREMVVNVKYPTGFIVENADPRLLDTNAGRAPHV